MKRDPHRTAARRFRGAAAGVAVALLAAAAVAVPGLAVAQAPVATTDPASNVTATTATLNGTVTPNQDDTRYYFQYGTTTEYGSQTPTEGPLPGNASKSVSADLTGLAPSTLYHFRLVAVNASGTSFGADRTFTTAASGTNPKEPNQVSISASRTILKYGRSTRISGRVKGQDNAGRLVTLEQNPHPYTGGFKPTGLTTTTDANGDYAFVVSPTENTRYRVRVNTSPPSTSPELAVKVRVRVGLRVSDRTPASGQRVRFAGKVRPGHDGKTARIQRRTKDGDWKTVARVTLRPATTVDGVTRSRYSKRIRVRRTRAYRVRVNPADGDHATGTSRRVRLQVH